MRIVGSGYIGDACKVRAAVVTIAVTILVNNAFSPPMGLFCKLMCHWNSPKQYTSCAFYLDYHRTNAGHWQHIPTENLKFCSNLIATMWMCSFRFTVRFVEMKLVKTFVDKRTFRPFFDSRQRYIVHLLYYMVYNSSNMGNIIIDNCYHESKQK